MKMMLIVDVDDELLEDYENFCVDYGLRAKRKDNNVTVTVRYAGDCPLKPLPERMHGYTYYNAALSSGWNALLDTILKD